MWYQPRTRALVTRTGSQIKPNTISSGYLSKNLAGTPSRDRKRSGTSIWMIATASHTHQGQSRSLKTDDYVALPVRL